MNALYRKVVRMGLAVVIAALVIALSAGMASAAGAPPPAIDLGSGYWLVDGEIVTEAELAEMILVPVTGTTPPLDLGSGYWLMNGKIVSESELSGQGLIPVTGLRAAAAPLTVIDIGGGCWLVKGPDGWQIISGSK